MINALVLEHMPHGQDLTFSEAHEVVVVGRLFVLHYLHLSVLPFLALAALTGDLHRVHLFTHHTSLCSRDPRGELGPGLSTAVAGAFPHLVEDLTALSDESARLTIPSSHFVVHVHRPFL